MIFALTSATLLGRCFAIVGNVSLKGRAGAPKKSKAFSAWRKSESSLPGVDGPEN